MENCTIEDLLAEKTKKEEKKPYEDRRQSYVDEFLSMKCCGDVLNVANPIGKKARKEITESMSIVKRLKKIVLKAPKGYTILDLCAGNALTSLISVHLFPNTNGIAIDKLERNREWDKVKRFKYVYGDIYDTKHQKYIKDLIDENTIIVSSHPCGQLARTIVDIYNTSRAKALFMLPCCDGKLGRVYPDMIFNKMGHYFVWCWDLALDFGGRVLLDKKVLSPKNILVYQIRKG